MSHVFAYLRVSTDDQDVANQRHGVARYCADRKLLAPVFVEDTASGRTDWCARPRHPVPQPDRCHRHRHPVGPVLLPRDG